MDHVVFSQSIADRASRLLSLVGALNHQYVLALIAIQQSGMFADIAEDLMTVCMKEKAEKMRLVEEDRQNRLRRYQLLDDNSAQAFMDEIEPKLKAWDERHAGMMRRQSQERYEFEQSMFSL